MNSVEFELISCEAGWLNIIMKFFDVEIPVFISTVFVKNFDDLIEKLYYLFPHNLSECLRGVGVVEYTGDEYDIPISTELYWDEEDSFVSWKIEREETQEINAKLKIKIEHKLSNYHFISIYECEKFDKEYNFEVTYKELCYAVAKLITELLKKHGFYGFFSSTYTLDINIRHFLLIKAVALDRLEIRELTYSKNDKSCERFTDLNEEIKLLLIDM